MKNKSLLGSVYLFITAFIWGVAFVFQRSGMDSIGPFTFMASRCILAVICLGLLLLCVKGPKKAFVFSKETVKGGLLCGVVMTIANNLQQAGMVYTEAGKAGFITALYILIVPVMSAVFFKYRPQKRVIAAILLGTVGLFLLCITEEFSIGFGDVLIILCAFAFSWHIIITDKFASRVDPIQLSFLQFAVCTVLGWTIAFIFEVPAVSDIKAAFIPIAYCGILSAGVAYTLQIFGQKYTEPTTASLIMCFESVFAALSGALILNERMTGRELAGCVIMFVAIILVEVKLPKKASDQDKKTDKQKKQDRKSK